MIKIAIDVMGGDNDPQEVLKGAIQAVEKFGDIELNLFGEAKIINDFFMNNNQTRINVFETTQVIQTQEPPVQAIRTKKDSSIVRALESCAKQESDAFVSAGSTGAVLAGATFIVKRIEGIKRPALCPLIPTVKGAGVLLVDCGANVDCKPQYLEQFAIMGSAYMKKIMNISNPKVALINNGAEEEKGNELTKAAFQLLKVAPINFVGNCEPRDIMSGDFDVVVADGFVGNVVLKTTEGVALSLVKMLKEAFMSSAMSKIGALLCKKALSTFKKRMDSSEQGGAILLGVNSQIIKAHGNSDAYAFFNAIRQARECVIKNVALSIKDAL